MLFLTKRFATGRSERRDRTRVKRMCHGFHTHYSDVLLLYIDACLDLREKDYYSYTASISILYIVKRE